MSLAEKIGPHLPNLRRFARLLTGRQAAGDAAVARLLEAIVADPALFPDLPPRIGLYQSFLNAFTARLEDPAAQADEIGKTAARSLAALPPQTRQAFLLVSVEEFDRAVVRQLHPLGQGTDCGLFAGGQRLDHEQQLVLLRLDPRRPGRLFAEAQEATNLVAHLAEVTIQPGDSVNTGSPLGTVGDTGSLRGTQLYFEIRKDGTPLDPMTWVRK